MIRVVTHNGSTSAWLDRLDVILDDAAETLGRAFNQKDVNLEAVDDDGTFLGGLSGYGQLGWFFVKSLALEPAARGKGAGRELMLRAEEIARDLGYDGIWVDTYDFQAPDFYRKLGYTEFGRLPANGEHPQRIWFAKVFDNKRTGQ